MNLPKEPGMLLSFINMKLRDDYSSLRDMCEDLDFDYNDLRAMLEESKLKYDEVTNQIKMK